MNTTMNATMNESTEGEKKMEVRKAETLKSLDELNLSEKTLEYIDKRGFFIDEIIGHGRFVAYNGYGTGGKVFYFDPERNREYIEYSIEIARALDEAGFINRILNPGTARLFDFVYSALYGNYRCYCGPGFHVYDHGNGGLNFAIYESIVTEEFYAKVRELIKDTLGSEAIDELMLERGSNRGKHKKLFKERVKHVEHDWLPNPGPNPAMEREINLLNNHLDSIRKLKSNPYFELVNSLLELKQGSEQLARQCRDTLGHYDDMREFAYYTDNHGFDVPQMAEKAREHYTALLDHESVVLAKLQECRSKLYGGFTKVVVPESFLNSASRSLDTSIECLGLRTQTFNALNRGTDIKTVGDVLEFRKNNNFYRIRNFGRVSANDLVEKMHLAGFTDFNI